ncbi:MAG: hypothetical protein ACK5HC_08890 [Dolichospermum sp.]
MLRTLAELLGRKPDDMLQSGLLQLKYPEQKTSDRLTILANQRSNK